MPHSTTETVVNGDTSPSSKTLSHITSYPTVASGIDTFKANPYGKKSIELVNNTYTRFGKPVEGYLEAPYQYAKPYVSKADELGDKALETVDGHFPIVKEKPETIYETGKSWVFWPYNYAKNAWDGTSILRESPHLPFQHARLTLTPDELQKTRKERPNQAAIFTLLSALLSFVFRLISDVLTAIADFTRPRYEATRDTTSEYLHNASAKADEAKKYAEERYAEARKYGEDKYAEARKRGQEIEGQAKESGEQAKEQAKETKEQAKEQAGKAKK